jgi:hypothetical protein
MTNVTRKLLAAAMVCIVSAGAFGQKRGGDKRPPKDDNKVVVQPKGEKPPQDKDQRGKKGGDKKGKH